MVTRLSKLHCTPSKPSERNCWEAPELAVLFLILVHSQNVHQHHLPMDWFESFSTARLLCGACGGEILRVESIRNETLRSPAGLVP